MKFPRTLTLETERCRLRVPTLDDIPHVFSATRYKGFNDGMLWSPPETEAELIKPFEDYLRAWEDGSAYSFGIDLLSGAFIGRIAIRRNGDGPIWNLGFWTHPEQQGKGYMTEAVARLMKFGFEELGASDIEACHASWNHASRRVLEKNGLRFVRVIPEGFKKHEEWVEERLMSISRQEWENLQRA